jgi:S1-C subfamily serine protease
MYHYAPGQVVKLEIVRGGRREIISVTLEEARPFGKEFMYGRKPGAAWLGLYLSGSMPYERHAAESYQIEYVVEVIPGSPADKAGIRTGDVICRETNQDIVDSLGSVKPGTKIKLNILRDLREKITVEVQAGEWGQGKEGL